MAAHQSKLGTLHELLAQAYADGIKRDMADEIFNPALLGAAAKFLKDNNITADIKSNDDLGALRDKLKAAADARRQAGSRILEAVRTGTDDE